ncbi:SRPBCC family protein [Planococcus sp. 1R117A]|uniref:SRPBCC family protein n=1 Tax=Planococcus sp. 1R117A TaxID=3447020 RepID=UPI003EDBE118
MRAEIIRNEQGYTATFERQLQQESDQVWAMLTENSKLQQWFAELTIEDLQKGGNITFDMGDGTFENMAILDYEEGKSIAFEWAEDEVHFEVTPENGGTKLVLVETINKITPHTARDLAGWHVCLDAIEAILNKEEIARQEEWNKEYPEYQRLLESMTGSIE